MRYDYPIKDNITTAAKEGLVDRRLAKTIAGATLFLAFFITAQVLVGF